MPSPHESRRQPRESADARSALMARLPSSFPLYLDSPRSQMRHLRAERSKPYSVTMCARPKTKLAAECPKARPPPNLGRGAFLKDETLRTLQGQVIRVDQGSCSRPCAGQLCEKYPSEPQRLPGFLRRRECKSSRNDGDRDCIMPCPKDSIAIRQRCDGESLQPGGKLGEDCEMPHCGLFDSSLFALDMDSTLDAMRDQLCVQVADDMFSMFLDENCMEAVE
ncbi:hypothetical protein C8F04DRAFT_1103855 [Mycena alexandri]|uniref:Uncharacterized protein n=1 Tax=Mycena alexandri TaxID=1745969 RepID=A0AAD6X2X5_9AGAR|nr:hypothetical protein C8F04DRAFT_1103855 [Mycena alexandri]